MKKLLFATVFPALLSTVAFGAEMTGYISDPKCATDHSKSASAAEWIHPKVFENCAVQCVKDEHETPIFLTSDNKMVKIDPASMEKAMPHLGHKVQLTGRIEGNTLKIDSITTVAWQ